MNRGGLRGSRHATTELKPFLGRARARPILFAYWLAQPMFAIDFDGVIADTSRLKSEWLRKNLGRDIPPWQCDHTTLAGLIGEETYQRMSPDVYGGQATHGVGLVDGAADALRTLARAGRIIVLTARTEEQAAFTRRYLADHDLADAVAEVVSSAESTKIAQVRTLGCRVLIDDDGRHLLGEGAEALTRLHLRPGAENPPASGPGIVVCTTWPEAVTAALEAVESLSE